MTDLIESNTWEPGIYQLELTDPVVGGAGGLSNLQPQQLANRTAWLKTLVESIQNDYAPKASPALTGTPTAPTAAPGANTTQLANTAFVKAAIAALVASSPAALDTLNELATALGNDPNFATTMTNALAAKAPLASPALTGTPTAPTQAAGDNSTRLATTAFVKAVETLLIAADALKAPLASPVLTGTPTAPTAAPGTNTTQLSTTAFVQAAIASLVASSPAALDTLSELATALGNDPNFATTITNALAAKAPLASPALTGVPTAPTAASTASTTQLATTAFVQAVLAAMGLKGTLLQADGDAMPSVGNAYGWHIESNGAVNYPLGVNDFWQGFQLGGGNANRGFDFAASLLGNRLTFRTRSGGVSGVWREVWHSGTFDPALKANLASPALTGTPTAPTAAPGTNTTQLSTTAFVQAAIAALVASSPAALDTLNELATALGNDPNFATTMTNALAAKAPLASPALTGNPTAPTQASGNNSTRLATTAFVQDAMTALGLGLGQTWQDVRASRAANTTYTNTTGKPIMVTLSQGTHLNTTFTYTVSGQTVTWSHSGSTTAIADTVSFIVPNGATYSSSALNTSWLELR
jgi:hypothetical protein